MSSTVFLKIFGERNTSTNALRKVIVNNFKDVQCLPSTASEVNGYDRSAITKINETYRGSERSSRRECYLDGFFRCDSIKSAWKHAATEVDHFDGDGITFIISVRHPVSWLLSLHRNPYHSLQPVENKFDDFIVQDWKTVERERLGGATLTPIELWNSKVSSYINFYERYRRRCQVFFVKFEDFALSQKNSLDQFVQESGLSFKEFQQLVQSSKNDNKNVEYYRNYYGRELWRDEVSLKSFDTIGGLIDHDLAEFLGYRL